MSATNKLNDALLDNITECLHDVYRQPADDDAKHTDVLEVHVKQC